MKKIIILPILLVFCCLNTTFAQTYNMTWTGASMNPNKYWDDADNWSGGDPVNMPYPYSHANTFFANATINASATIYFKSGSATTVKNLNITSGNVVFATELVVNPTRAKLFTESVASTDVNMTIASGATLTLSNNDVGFLLINYYGIANINGTLDIAGTNISLNFYAGFEHKNTDVFNITNVNSGGTVKMSGAGARFTSTWNTNMNFFSGSTLWFTRLDGVVPSAKFYAGSNIQCDNRVAYNNLGALYGGDIHWNVAGQAGVLGDYTWGLSSTALYSNFGGTFFMQAGHLRMTGGVQGSSFGAINVSGGGLDFRPTATATASAGSITVSGGLLTISGVASGTSALVTINVSGDVVQTGGIIDLAKGINNGVINVSGNVVQTGGTLTESGTSSGSSIVFKGTSLQNATFSGTVSGDKLIVTVNNNRNHVNLLANAILPYRLQCSTGDMILGSSYLSVADQVFGVRKSGATGGSVVTNGTGALTIKSVNNIGKNFPVASSSASHDAVYITNNAAGVFDCTVRVSQTISPVANLIIANTIPRQWEIVSASSATNLEFDPDPIAGSTAVGTRTIGRFVSPMWVLTNAIDGVNNGYPYAADFTAYGSFVVGSTTAIPVELVEFKAKATTNNNLLTWTTATERNAERFDIQRSNDGVSDWNTIGSVKAKGNSVASLTYEFADATPLATSYYRLQSMDVDGKTDVSKIVSVNRKGNGKLSLDAVNRVYTEGSFFNVDINLATSGNLNVSLMDAVGRVVSTKSYATTEGANLIQFNTANLANGMYILNLSNNEGSIAVKMMKR
jgi:hypothetical protein